MRRYSDKTYIVVVLSLVVYMVCCANDFSGWMLLAALSLYIAGIAIGSDNSDPRFK
jgi:hypothetical protein